MILRTSALVLVTLSVFLPATQAAAQNRIAVGQQAPTFALESSAGETYDLSSLNGEKKLLLVFFRGTW